MSKRPETLRTAIATFMRRKKIAPRFDEERSEQQTVSLVRHGPYELRLVELSRKMQTGTKQLWLELFDHDHQHTIDSYSGRTLVDITAVAESLCSSAKDLSKSTH